MKLNKNAKEKLKEIKSEEVVVEEVEKVSAKELIETDELKESDIDDTQRFDVMNLTHGRHVVTTPQSAVSSGISREKVVFKPKNGSSFGQIKKIKFGTLRALADWSGRAFEYGKLKILNPQIAELLGTVYDNGLDITPQIMDSLFKKDTDKIIAFYKNSHPRAQAKIGREFLIRNSRDEFSNDKAKVLTKAFNVKV